LAGNGSPGTQQIQLLIVSRQLLGKTSGELK
jgi:hypothetical protein